MKIASNPQSYEAPSLHNKNINNKNATKIKGRRKTDNCTRKLGQIPRKMGDMTNLFKVINNKVLTITLNMPLQHV